MRELLFAAMLSAVFASGCRSSAAPPSPGPTPTSARPSTAAPSGHERELAPDPVGRDVTLTFRDADDEPVIGRTVRVVDERGARLEGLTDEEGGIVFPGVVQPYDALVEGSPSLGARGTPTVLLGLTRSEGRFDVDERDDSPPPPAQSFRVGLPVACDAPACEAWITTASPSGQGALHLDARPAGDVEVVTVSHAFEHAVLAPGERVRIGAVLAGIDRSSFSVAEVSAVASPGDVTDVGTLTPVPLPTRDVVAELDPRALPDGWARGLEAALRFGDGPDVVQRTTTGSVIELRAPERADAVTCVRAWAERPGPLGADLHAGAQSQVCARGSPTMTVSLAAPFEPLAPRPGEALSRRGQGMRWEPSATSRLVDVRLVDELAARVVVRVVTSGTAVPMVALARLGIVLPVGPMVADVRVTEDAVLDVVAAPRAGAVESFRRTSRRYRFVVAP